MAIARPYFRLSGDDMVALLSDPTNPPTDDVIAEAKFRSTPKVKKALAQALASRETVQGLSLSQLKAQAAVAWLTAYNAGSVETRQSEADAAFRATMLTLLQGEPVAPVTTGTWAPAPEAPKTTRKAKTAGKPRSFNPLKVSAAAVANASGHPVRSAGWWDAYKAQTALQREHNITAADFEGMSREDIIAAATPVSA